MSVRVEGKSDQLEENINSIVKQLKDIYLDCPENIVDKFSSLFAVVIDSEDMKPIENDFFGFCLKSKEIKVKDKIIKLTPFEGRVFYKLALSLGNVVHRDIIYKFLYNNYSEKETCVKVIDVYVSKINKSIIPHQLKIESSWGFGYKLTHSIPKLYVTNPNYKITINGETRKISDFLQEKEIDYKVFWSRVRVLGWDTYKAILEPRRHNRKENYVLNRFFTHNGEKKTIGQWAKELNLNRVTVRYRINNLKWPIEKAIFFEVNNNHGRHRAKKEINK
jgi:DNA-binding winged helix-turn-helix (wHTH) protein